MTHPVVLWNKAFFGGLGIVLLAATFFRPRLYVGRLLMSLLLLVAAFALIWEDMEGGDLRFTAAWLTVVMFFAVGTVPFQPWQTGTLCVAITILYTFLATNQPILSGGLPTDVDAARLIYLGIVSLLCMTMSSAIYVSRLEQYRSRMRVERMQDQLVQKEKLASLGHLTAGIAHEIKNPLNFVNNFAQLSQESVRDLLDNLEANPSRSDREALDEVKDALDELHTNAEKIAEHGRRADNIVKNMLGHSRKMPGERRPVDLNTLTDQYIGLAFHAMRAQHTGFEVQIDRDFDDELGSIPVVPDEIGRVVLNLLDNAFDAVRARKLVEQAGYEPRVRVATNRTSDGATITIADNGGGISEEHRARIFEPFFTTKPTGQGTGLGLSLGYDIVTAGHDGTMSFDSIDGEGATFWLELPASPMDGS